MKYLFLIASTLIFAGCAKDKLVNESAILVGTWTWHHSIEYTYDVVTSSEVSTIIPATNYPNKYAVTFKKRGKVSTLKDGQSLEEYRVILDLFKSGSCDLQAGYQYRINLNDKATDTIVGCVNADTLTMSDLHLPLSKGSTQYPYYVHVYLK